MRPPVVPRGARLAVPLLLACLLAAAAPARAATPLRSAVLEQRNGTTRLVLESSSELRFTLFIRRLPDRLVLEIEDLTDHALLDLLPAQVPPGHPHLKQLRVQPASPGQPLRLELALRGETYPAVRTLKPADGHGYRLVLDVAVPPAPAPSVAPAAAPAAAALPPPPGASANDEPLLFDVTLDEHVLAEAITAYHDGRRVFLPLGELAGILTLAVRTQPAQGTAEGFLLSEDRGFRLNVPQARVVVGEEAQTFDPALVRVRGDDIYVESTLLARWWPVEFHPDLARLRLRVRPRETLPLQSRLQRERTGARAGGYRPGTYEDPGYPRLESPHQWLSVPFIDQTFGLGLQAGNGGSAHSASYTAYLTGDLAGLESSLYVSTGREGAASELRYTLGRHDPDGQLLGPLRARTALFGSGVGLPGVPHVALRTAAGDGHGLTVSNRPLNAPTQFDRHTLEGDLPPGWDVELFYNDALAGFQRSGPAGRYSFVDLPLSWGPNEFRLVFHGPLGQRRVERQSFLLDQLATPAGALHYSLTEHRDGQGQARSVAQFDWGVSKNLSASAGWVRLPQAGVDATAANYGRLGLRTFIGNVAASTDWWRSPGAGWLSDTAVKTRIGRVALDYNHLHLRDFTSEAFPNAGDPLRMRDKVRLQSVLPAGRWLPSLPVTLELQRDRLASGASELLVGGRVSAFVRNTSLAHQLAWHDVRGQRSLAGSLAATHRVGDLGLSGQVGYRVRPDAAVESVAVRGEQRLGEGYLASLGVTRAFASRETIYAASLTKSQGHHGLGLNATWSQQSGFTLGLQLFVAMEREPREGRWNFDALPKADSGAASVRLFLDDNGNGVRDAGEEPIANAGVTVNGSHLPARTNEAGIVWLDRLPAHTPTDLAVDAQTLEDPFWRPQRPGVRLVPRPGHVATVDFPVILTAEIDGTVFLDEAGGRRGIGNAQVELVDAAGQVVATVKSSSDGYYVLDGVKPGRYTLRIAPQQLRQLGLAADAGRAVAIGADGKFVHGADFLLTRQP